MLRHYFPLILPDYYKNSVSIFGKYSTDYHKSGLTFLDNLNTKIEAIPDI